MQDSRVAAVIDLDDSSSEGGVQARQQQAVGMTDDAPGTETNAICQSVGPDKRWLSQLAVAPAYLGTDSIGCVHMHTPRYMLWQPTGKSAHPASLAVCTCCKKWWLLQICIWRCICFCRVTAVQPTSSGNADEAAGKSSKVVGVSYKAAGSISALVAHVNSSLSSQQQITSQQAETLQTVAGNVSLLLGLEAVQDSTLSDDLNDVLEIDAKMNSKQILEVRRFLRDYRQQPSAAGP